MHAQHLDAFRRARVMRGACKQGERAGHIPSITLADRRQLELPRCALKEPAPHEALQVCDLMADGGGGHIELVGRLVDAVEASDHFERDDSLKRRQSIAAAQPEKNSAQAERANVAARASGVQHHPTFFQLG